MTVDRESHEHEGPMCCRPWMRHSHPASRLRMGILLIVIGGFWLSIKTGLLDFAWLRLVPIWPLVLILIGLWMSFEGSKRHENMLHQTTNREE